MQFCDRFAPSTAIKSQLIRDPRCDEMWSSKHPWIGFMDSLQRSRPVVDIPFEYSNHVGAVLLKKHFLFSVKQKDIPLSPRISHICTLRKKSFHSEPCPGFSSALSSLTPYSLSRKPRQFVITPIRYTNIYCSSNSKIYKKGFMITNQKI